MPRNIVVGGYSGPTICVKTGEIKSFTGMSKDAPYEPPPNPEINLPNYKMTVEESVDMLITELRKAGVLSGGPVSHTIF